MKQHKPLAIGTKLGGYEVAGPPEIRKGFFYYPSLCKCGQLKSVLYSFLKTNRNGCAKCSRKAKATHGEADKTIEWKTWKRIRERCHSPSSKHFKNYGAKGIQVCDSWRNSYANFLKDMGRRPEDKTSIDRIDSTKGYQPDNCRWADKEQQANNTNTNTFLSFDDKKLTIAQWARLLGKSQFLISLRLRRGWSIERTLTT